MFCCGESASRNHHVLFLSCLVSWVKESNILRLLDYLTIILIGLPWSSDTLTTDILKNSVSSLQRQCRTKFCQHFSLPLCTLCCVTQQLGQDSTLCPWAKPEDLFPIQSNRGHLLPIMIRSPFLYTPLKLVVRMHKRLENWAGVLKWTIKVKTDWTFLFWQFVLRLTQIFRAIIPNMNTKWGGAYKVVDAS